MTNNTRTYGNAPHTIAVIHGGPGAGGEMAPVARNLQSDWNILEPIQTTTSLDGQVDELKTVLENHADLPVTLIGYSWGAWLAWIVAAKYPALVRKLILVSSGPFEAHYARKIGATRSSRLSSWEREDFAAAIRALSGGETENMDDHLQRLGDLAHKADTYDPYDDDLCDTDLIGAQGDVFQNVWNEAASLRASGELLELAQHIQCPVVAIHGDYDTHPAEGVEKPLSAILPNFRFHLLEYCGHTPWRERYAHEAFYRILREIL